MMHGSNSPSLSSSHEVLSWIWQVKSSTVKGVEKLLWTWEGKCGRVIYGDINLCFYFSCSTKEARLWPLGHKMHYFLHTCLHMKIHAHPPPHTSLWWVDKLNQMQFLLTKHHYQILKQLTGFMSILLIYCMLFPPLQRSQSSAFIYENKFALAYF